jgi:hypothetical protein
MSTPESALRMRNLRMLALLGGLFMLPLAFAFLTYYGTGWRPLGRVNHGELITPARPLPQATLAQVLPQVPAASPAAALFHDRWTLVYIGDGTCGQACQDTLYVMRQTRLSLNNDMTRVARVFLATANCCNTQMLGSEHAGLVVEDATGAAAQPLLQTFPAGEREHTLFIVDPLGNLMMSYDARQDPHGLLEDLKKLLRLSHIG